MSPETSPMRPKHVPVGHMGPKTASRKTENALSENLSPKARRDVLQKEVNGQHYDSALCMMEGLVLLEALPEANAGGS